MRLFIKIFLFLRKLLSWLLLLPVYFYQKFISPITPSMCRFEPTCSQFMVEAIKKKGPIWGLILGIYRILRCNPFNPGGYDPVDRYPPFTDGKRKYWRLSKNISQKIKINIADKSESKVDTAKKNDIL